MWKCFCCYSALVHIATHCYLSSTWVWSGLVGGKIKKKHVLEILWYCLITGHSVDWRFQTYGYKIRHMHASIKLDACNQGIPCLADDASAVLLFSLSKALFKWVKDFKSYHYASKAAFLMSLYNVPVAWDPTFWFLLRCFTQITLWNSYWEIFHFD